MKGKNHMQVKILNFYYNLEMLKGEALDICIWTLPLMF